MEMKDVVWSHSRLNKLFENPAEYFLIYEEGIKPKQEKAALSIGSAVHWLLENNTTDLTEYYKEKGDLLQWNDYSDEQCIAESLAEAFFRKKMDIYKIMLLDHKTGKVLDIISEEHELSLTMEYASKLFKKNHKFLGIIDLLILTEKGWILIDYKTSSQKVDWDNYKSQLYKYIHLINFNFPEFPVWKIVIINLRKTQIRRKKNENDESFRQRIRQEYELNEDELIECHVYNREEFEEKQLELQKESLIEMMDLGQVILNNRMFFTNYSNIVGQYGPSQYYDIFYKTPDNHNLYTIKDMIYDEDENDIVTSRNCEPLDMLVLDNKNDILNKYYIFKEQVKQLQESGVEDDETVFKTLKQKYTCDDKLLKKLSILLEYKEYIKFNVNNISAVKTGTHRVYSPSSDSSSSGGSSGGGSSGGGSGGGGGNGGGGKIKDLSFETLSQEYSVDELVIEFLLQFSHAKKNVDVSVIVDSESGRIDPAAWQKDIGTPFPANITALQVYSIKSPIIEDGLQMDAVCSSSTREIENEYVKVGIHHAESSAEYSSFSVAANVLNLELRGAIKIRARDKKYKFSLRVV